MNKTSVNPKYFIGVDPGLTGGLVCVNAEGELVFSLQFPLKDEGTRTRKVRGKNQKQSIRGIDSRMLWLNLNSFMGMIDFDIIYAKVFLEKVWLMKGQGISTGSTFMDNYGRLKTILSLIYSDYINEAPSVWQHALFGKQKYEKSIGRNFCMSNLKDYHKLIPSGKKVIPDGLSDAYCMAEYLRRKTIGV